MGGLYMKMYRDTSQSEMGGGGGSGLVAVRTGNLGKQVNF